MQTRSLFFALMRHAALTGVLLVSAVTAFAGKTYSDNGNGTVTDPGTGLTWMRCAVGQTWSANSGSGTCAGNATSSSWDQARALTGSVSFAGQSDWRLPTVRELQTLVERSAYYPALDARVFPNTTNAASVWSATALTGTADKAWLVYFDFGRIDSSATNNTHQVRLVRGAPAMPLLNVARPDADYVDHGNGTVTHIPTGLMWQTCAWGQSWSAGTCTNDATALTWLQATALTSNLGGHADWRLPTEDELLSLVDYSQQGLALNTRMFPGTPDAEFWSTTPFAYLADSAWRVNLGLGSASFGLRNVANTARLVRAGLPLGVYSLSVSKTSGGQVSGGELSGIVCGAQCSANFTEGTRVTLTATPSASFTAWGGACVGSNPNPVCVVTMDRAKSVSATFQDLALNLSIQPQSLAFGTQNIGSKSAPKSLTLTNAGTGPITISAIASSTTEFIVATDCESTLSPGSFCTLDVVFMPDGSGERVGTVKVTHTVPGGIVTDSVAVSGTGQGSYSTISPTSLSFAAQGVGSTSTSSVVTLTNTGPAILKLESPIIFGDFVSVNHCDSSLAVNESCTIEVSLSPSTAGVITGKLVIPNNGIFNPQTVQLSGVGRPTMLSHNALNFAAQAVGETSVAQTVTLTNISNAAISFVSITPSPDFLLNHSCGSGLLAGASCRLNINFKPSAEGTRVGAVRIAFNDGGSADVVALSGGAGMATQTIVFEAADPALVDVGQPTSIRATASSGLQVTFAVANDPSHGCNFSDTAFDGSVSSAKVTCNAPGTYKIDATQAGVVNSFEPALPASQSITVVAREPAVRLSPSALTFAPQHVGSASATQTISLENVGNAPLSFVRVNLIPDVFNATSDCPATLSPAQSCSIQVFFKPTQVGTRVGSVSVVSNAVSSPVVVVSGTGVASDVPICSLSASRLVVRKNGSSTLTASCDPVATSYQWFGNACTASTGDTCIVTPDVSTSYSVIGSNSAGSSEKSTLDITVKAFDITPILMLLLD